MKLVFIAAAAAVMAGCASTEFRRFEAREDLVIEGRGGSRTVHDGVDIWEIGEPPRRFKVIGFIEDERPGGAIPMAQLKGDVAKKAKEAGGDALIQIRSESQITGYQTIGSASASGYGNRSTASGFTTTVPFSKSRALFAVIKYVN